MAEIAPFRGIVYDTSKVSAPDVLAPPYDVIDDAGRAALAARSPHNCVRLILPEADEQASGGDRYQAAAGILDTWLAEGVLRQDDRPAIYRYHQVFKVADFGDRTITRRGFIAAVKLHDFAEGVILPHERTLKGPKADRLALMKATSAHFSQIFTMYRDPSGETDRVFAAAESGRPYLEASTDDGTRHLLWRVSDREAIGELTRLMAPLKLYIADGHHRYETMLALREHFRQLAGGALSSHSQAQYGTMFLANMNDHGLIVLPTHRLIHGVEGFDAGKFLDRTREFFDVEVVDGAATDAERVRAAIAGDSGRTTFAAIFPDGHDAYVLSLKPSVDLAAVGVTGHSSVTRLDVTLLHGLLLERVLGVSRAAQEAQTNIEYIKDTAKAIEKNAAGQGQVTFIMNPTSVNQVKAVAEAGETMPQKSTFFFPKIASGVVINRIDPDQDLY